MRAVDNLLEFLLVFLLFEEVRHIEEGVAFEPYVDECRLHSGKNPGHATLVDRTCERVFVLTLKINFVELLVFHDRHFGFVRCG
jgi:hypothetical protein